MCLRLCDVRASYNSLIKRRKDLPILQHKPSDKRHVGLPDLMAPDARRNVPASKADVMASSGHVSAGERKGAEQSYPVQELQRPADPVREYGRHNIFRIRKEIYLR